jgi:hypothetical protein
MNDVALLDDKYTISYYSDWVDFTASETERITGVPQATIRTWRTRGFLPPPSVVGQYSAIDVARIKILKDASDLGLELSIAAEAAESAALVVIYYALKDVWGSMIVQGKHEDYLPDLIGLVWTEVEVLDRMLRERKRKRFEAKPYMLVKVLDGPLSHRTKCELFDTPQVAVASSGQPLSIILCLRQMAQTLVGKAGPIMGFDLEGEAAGYQAEEVFGAWNPLEYDISEEELVKAISEGRPTLRPDKKKPGQAF